MEVLTRQRPPATAEGDGRVADLVARAADGDDGAWNELVSRFGGLVWSIARAHGLDRATAADVAQTVWLRLLDHLDRLLQPGRVGAWLASTTRRECLRQLRLNQRTAPTADAEILDGRDDRMPDDPTAAVVDREQAAALGEVLATMPERSQALLRLLMADPPASYAEVSEGLGIPMGSIGPTRQRCLHALRARCLAAGIEL